MPIPGTSKQLVLDALNTNSEFQASMPTSKRGIRVPIEATNYEDLDIQPNLSYKEHSIQILDRAERKTRNKFTKFVKVQWSRHSEREATWEQEDQFRQSYPELFEIEYVHSQPFHLPCSTSSY